MVIILFPSLMRISNQSVLSMKITLKRWVRKYSLVSPFVSWGWSIGLLEPTALERWRCKIITSFGFVLESKHGKYNARVDCACIWTSRAFWSVYQFKKFATTGSTVNLSHGPPVLAFSTNHFKRKIKYLVGV